MRKLKRSLILLTFAAAAPAAFGAVREGNAAPDFTIPVNGAQVRLSDLRGHVVVLDFWASWCPYCVKGLPQTQAIARKYRDVVVMGVDSEDASTIAAAKKQLGLTFRVFQDRDDRIAESYGVDGIPVVVVIGADGRVVSVIEGFHADDPAERAVAALMK
jgi:cytochrome c biogenesis protein CcmG, thiol:disulfide interchange protein DsbE